MGSETILLVGAHYEVKNSSEITKYYYAGGQRIAMRKNGTLTYMLTDHLGSTSLTTDTSGAVISELRYGPWGNVRYQGGTTSTPYQYTGQYSYQSDFGLYFYNARFYDPALGRFTAADSLVPGGVQGLDRYAYVNNNPVRYTDPSGHRCVPEDECVGSAGQGEPDSVDFSQLTQAGKNRAYSGWMMYSLYFRAWEAKGGYLTIKQFIILMLSHEFQPLGGADDNLKETLKTAAGNWFWCSPNADTNACTNLRKDGTNLNAGMLNWVAGMESARRRYDHVQGGADAWAAVYGTDEDRNVPLAVEVTNFMLHESRADGHLYLNTPFYWANLSLPLGEDIKDANPGYAPNQFVVSWPYGSDPFYILTPCQTDYWRGTNGYSACH